jgi:hypothetical protein
MCEFRNQQWRLFAILMKAFLFVPLIIAATMIVPNLASAQTWTTAPDAGFQFTRFDGEYSLQNGNVYFLGGRLPDNSTDGSVWSYDPVSGAYADTGVDMPVPISNYQIARLTDSGGNEWFMIFGGRDNSGAVVNTVQGYNPVTNATIDFTSTDPYPELTSPGGVEVVGNKAYSFGGFDAVVTTAGCHVFDINAADGARWSSCPDLNMSRSYIGTAVVDGVIYAFGGDTFDGANLIAQTITEKLDTANPTAWDDASVADLPVACDEFRSFGFDTSSGYDVAGKIIAAGCGQWPNAIADSSIYDVAANTWDTTFADLNIIRRNHAGVFIPVGTTGAPGLWVFGGYDSTGGALVATPEYYTVVLTGPTCNMFGDDFEDGVLDPNWTYEKPTWTETGGSLTGTPVKKSARAIATPAFGGCNQCTIETHVSTAGGAGNKVWIYTFYVDKRNKVELLAKEENDKWVLKQRVNNAIVAKAKGLATIDPNVVYDVVIAFDGTTFTVTVDGTSLITLPAGGTVPTGTVGFQVKNTTGSFGDICIN